MAKALLVPAATNTVSWIISLDTKPSILKRYLEQEYGKTEGETDSFQAFFSLQHETQHFWQAISTVFLYFHSLDYLSLCFETLQTISRHQLRFVDLEKEVCENEKLRKLALEFYEMSGKLRSCDNQQFNARHILEGAAVLCSYRICYSKPSHEHFMQHIKGYHRPEYCKAYEFAAKLLGHFAFDLFSPACYLALHFKNPGHNLEAILRRAREGLDESDEIVFEDPLGYLLRAVQFPMDRLFPFALKQLVSPSSGVPPHSVLLPYVEHIARMAPVLPIHDFFARPYFYSGYAGWRSEKMKDFMTDMLPPAHMYLQDSRSPRCLRAGLARRLGDHYIHNMNRCTAIIGLAERIVGILSEKSPLGCRHKCCPVHQTGLCQNFFAYPDEDFRQCHFPDLLGALNLDALRDSVM